MSKATTRKRPIYNRVRQQDWLLWRMMSEHKCCMCGELLIEGYNKKEVNVTVHHVEGSIHTDDRSVACPDIESQLFSHSNCHRAYHHMERMINKGHNVDMARFRNMERNIKREIKRIQRNK